MRLNYPVFLVLVPSVLLTSALWLKPAKVTVVCFDRQTIQAQFIHQLAQLKATENQVAKASLRFKSLLQKTLQHYSQTNKVIIVDSQLLLAGGIDVTKSIAKELAFAMRKPS